MSLQEQLSAALENPNVQRYLSMLKKAEGTDKYADPYRTAGGGKVMLPDLDQYRPVSWDFKQTDGKMNKSTAAGAYQFIQPTWQDISANLGLKDFSPRSQDLGALYLMQRNGSLADVMAGRFDAAVQKDGSTWASLPSSPYPQGKRSNEFIQKALGQDVAAAPAIAPKPRPAFQMNDGRMIEPRNERELSKLESIQASSFSDEAKKRMADLAQMLPKQKASDAPLFGDPYPDLMDKELRDLIDSV